MEWFAEGLVAGMYGVFATTFVAALVTLGTPHAYWWLKAIVTANYIAVAIQTIGAIVVLLAGQGPFPLITALGYAIVAPLLLPLYGIGRLGEPPAPGEKRDPDAPVLSPRQIQKVDAMAAMIVATALAVIAWRLSDVLAPVGA